MNENEPDFVDDSFVTNAYCLAVILMSIVGFGHTVDWVMRSPLPILSRLAGG